MRMAHPFNASGLMAVPGVCRLSVSAGTATVWIHEPTNSGVEGAVLIHHLKSSFMQCVTQRQHISVVYLLVTGEANVLNNKKADRIAEQLQSVLATMDLLECPLIGLLAGSASILGSILVVHCDDLIALQGSELQFGGALSTKGMPVDYAQQVGLLRHVASSSSEMLRMCAAIPVSNGGAGPDSYRLKCEIRTRTPCSQANGMQADLRSLAEAIAAGLSRPTITKLPPGLPIPSQLSSSMSSLLQPGVRKPTMLMPLAEDTIFEDAETEEQIVSALESPMLMQNKMFKGLKPWAADTHETPVSQLLAMANQCLRYSRQTPAVMPPPAPKPPVQVRKVEVKPKKEVEVVEGPITSLMLCNIPCRVTQEGLLEVVESLGFKDTYDFLYLPIGGRPSTSGVSNLGYGFINFKLPEQAEAFAKVFADYQFQGTTSKKVCAARPAHVQGLYNNVERLSSTTSKLEPRGRQICPLIKVENMSLPWPVLSTLPKESLELLFTEGLSALPSGVWTQAQQVETMEF